jgi:L-fuconolactonase
MIIDSHLHVWNLAAAHYGWLGPHLREVDRDIEMAEVAPTLGRLGIDGVVLVQAADNAEDTVNMLRVADENPAVRGVVGWVDVDDPTSARSQLDALTSDPRVVGIRNLIHDREDPAWVFRPGFADGLALLEERRIPFDFVTADHRALASLARIAADHPGMTFVLDHLGKPPINGAPAGLEDWADALRAVAELPNVVAKVSGLYSSVGSEDSWTQAGLDRVVAVAVDAFGAERLMYGSDWPMSLRAGGYERVFVGLQRAVRGWSDGALDDFWWRTAARTYGLAAAAPADATRGGRK